MLIYLKPEMSLHFTEYLSDWDNGSADHVGIVTEVEGSKIRTIEGNREPVVKEYEYDYVQGSGRILGYGILPEKPEQETQKK